MKPVLRLALYLLGLFVTAFGINIAIRADLGVTPVSAFTLTLSKIAGVSLGTVTVVVYCLFVLAEIPLLGRRFQARNLLQAAFTFAFGFFIDISALFLKWLSPHGYLLQVLWLLIGVAVMSLGVMLILSMDIVPNAPDGIVLAFCERTGMPFSNAKFGFDCICVVLSIAFSLAFLGRISTVREGTVIAALLTGRLIGLFAKPCVPWLQRVALPGEASVALAAD